MAEAVETETLRRRQTMVGKVIGDAMDKTIVVQVEKTVMHPLYRRYVKQRSKYYAHDEKNESAVGDRVEIVASRPLSRLKRWRLRRVLERGPGA